ncbi:unnamed protein product [Schistosoma mattheei]|uniref:Uncharacterized protein n=1 Tax=Schistosoma mattheei TaxID=31246 RepID=A0A3P8IP87_9TREM|nr:unnamed protein product [Schistosoma mattheei]
MCHAWRYYVSFGVPCLAFINRFRGKLWGITSEMFAPSFRWSIPGRTKSFPKLDFIL